MAEILVQVRQLPNANDDPAVFTQPGDVIVVMPDGHGWGSSEAGNQTYSIWAVPGAPVEDFAHMTQPALSVPNQETGTQSILLQRAMAYDLTYAPLTMTVLGRSEVTFDSESDLAALEAAEISKPIPLSAPEFVTLG
jgi:hypothetical protein